MADEEMRAAERLALLQEADGLLKTITTKHDIEIGNRLRSILIGVNAMVDVAEGEVVGLNNILDEQQRQVDAVMVLQKRTDRRNARLQDQVNALKYENEQLRDGVAPADDPEALFDQLEKSVARLTLNMKKARAEEGGLFCGKCGANIADNAQGVQVLRDRIAELEADAVAAEEPVDTEGVAGDELVAAHALRLIGDLGFAAPEVWSAHILRAMDRLAHAIRLELEPVPTCNYCDAPFDDAGECKCEGADTSDIPF